MIARDEEFRPDPEPSSVDETQEPNQDTRAGEETSEARPQREDGSLGRQSTTEDAVTDPSAWSFPPDTPDRAEGPADSRASRFHTAEDPEAEAAPRRPEDDENR